MDADHLHTETPTIESLPISGRTGKAVWLKMDCFQPTGSFKIRGVGFRCRECVEAGAAHLVSSSGGNAGLAVAYAGRELGVRVTVAVPETASEDVRKWNRPAVPPCQQSTIAPSRSRTQIPYW